MTIETRQPKGIPVGGQFASVSHGEGSVTLASPDAVISQDVIDQDAVDRFAGEQNLALAAATARKLGHGMAFQYTFPEEDVDDARFQRAFAIDAEGRLHDINGATSFESHSMTLDPDHQDLVGIHPDRIEIEIADYEKQLPPQDFDAAGAYSDVMLEQNQTRHHYEFDSPEDRAAYEKAVAFARDAEIGGTIEPGFIQYRPDDGLDVLRLTVDDASFTIRGTGGPEPEINYDVHDEGGGWSFHSQQYSPPRRGDHETLHALVTGARHDVACQKAWLGDEETFRTGAAAQVDDFGVDLAPDGSRIVTLDLTSDGRPYTLRMEGGNDIQVFIDDQDAPLPLASAKLDSLALDFDEDHDEGTGDIRFRSMMRDAADRAERRPGFAPKSRR